MATILATVTFEHASGLPEDRYVNTFWFDGPTSSGASDIIAANLEDFYNNTNGGAGDLGNYISDVIDRTAGTSRIKLYDMTTPPAGTPYADYSFNLDSSGVGNNLPSEVAVCLSFKATASAGGIAARRRGRIYFGPLTDNAIDYVGQVPRVDATLTGFLLASANRLHDAAAGGGVPWIVHSRAWSGFDKNGNPVPSRPAYPATNHLITSGWVDDSFDTQRRRGEASSGRTTLAF